MLFGIVVALIVLIVVATLFITVEYRRGLIRTTFTAIPQRGSVLAAKALVIAIVAFIDRRHSPPPSLFPLGVHVLDTGGNYIFPTNALTLVQIIAGTGALLAITAVGVLALGDDSAHERRSRHRRHRRVHPAQPPRAGSARPGGPGGFTTGCTDSALPRPSPVFGAFPRSSLVSFPYTLANGYYPLGPWAGLARLVCSTAAVALAAGHLPAAPERRMTAAAMPSGPSCAPSPAPPGCSSALLP